MKIEATYKVTIKGQTFELNESELWLLKHEVLKQMPEPYPFAITWQPVTQPIEIAPWYADRTDSPPLIQQPNTCGAYVT